MLPNGILLGVIAQVCCRAIQVTTLGQADHPRALL
jgi:hypothetical protein